ncbi:hypothetical protein [Actinoallomurus iriomotensis]|jgi:hypothetical protein|uniref:Uncharacterized protein n=1 Tax=Actinoallomurus iriomotensis TaxID=478107 RepID=A0A9W6VUU5_9ACTN|nr:hypothetical protein [Actinoallomurus iriomotensis]GLY80529.1 hypothetical protein Airi01_087960 [Actinoallomurus iriomotensis]
MDKDTDFVLDQLINQTAESALATLTAAIDIEQRLRDLHQAAEANPETDVPGPGTA